MRDRAVRPVEDDRAHLAEDDLGRGEIAVIEALWDRACGQRSTRGHEGRGARPQRLRLVERQTACAAHAQQRVVGEEARDLVGQAVERSRGDGGRLEGPAICGEHTLKLGQPGQRRRPGERFVDLGQGRTLHVIGDDPAEAAVRGDDGRSGPRVDVGDQFRERDLMREYRRDGLGPHPSAVGLEPGHRRSDPDPDRHERPVPADAALGEPFVDPVGHLVPPRPVVVDAVPGRKAMVRRVGSRLRCPVGHGLPAVARRGEHRRAARRYRAPRSCTRPPSRRDPSPVELLTECQRTGSVRENFGLA